MYNTTIEIHGLFVPICYSILGEKQIQWCLDKDSDEMTEPEYMLLEFLLRMHHCCHIDRLLADEWQAHVYEADAKAAATAQDIPF